MQPTPVGVAFAASGTLGFGRHEVWCWCRHAFCIVNGLGCSNSASLSLSCHALALSRSMALFRALFSSPTHTCWSSSLLRWNSHGALVSKKRTKEESGHPAQRDNRGRRATAKDTANTGENTKTWRENNKDKKENQQRQQGRKTKTTRENHKDKKGDQQ